MRSPARTRSGPHRSGCVARFGDEVERELADVAGLDLADAARDEVVVEELHRRAIVRRHSTWNASPASEVSSCEHAIPTGTAEVVHAEHLGARGGGVERRRAPARAVRLMEHENGRFGWGTDARGTASSSGSPVPGRWTAQGTRRRAPSRRSSRRGRALAQAPRSRGRAPAGRPGRRCARFVPGERGRSRRATDARRAPTRATCCTLPHPPVRCEDELEVGRERFLPHASRRAASSSPARAFFAER